MSKGFFQCSTAATVKWSYCTNITQNIQLANVLSITILLICSGIRKCIINIDKHILLLLFYLIRIASNKIYDFEQQSKRYF